MVIFKLDNELKNKFFFPDNIDKIQIDNMETNIIPMKLNILPTKLKIYLKKHHLN